MKQSITIFLFLLASTYSFSQITLVSPSNNITLNTQEVRFQWNIIEGASAYQILISDDEDFNTFTPFDCEHNDTIITLGYGDYYWKVLSDNSSESNIRFFSVFDVYSTNPFGWYKSDSGVVLDIDDKVETWNDMSGNELNAFQSNSTLRPNYSTLNNEINGYPLVKFPGSGLLNTPDYGILDVEILFFGKGNQHQNNFIRIGEGYRVNGPGSSGGMIFLTGTNYQYFSPQQETEVFQIHHFGYLNGNAASEESFIRVNGNYLEKGLVSDGSGFITNNLRIGGNVLDGEFAEIIVFNSFLSDEERASFYNYFRSKYAPPVNLGLDLSYSLCDTTLSAGERFESYVWSTGETSESINVNESGTYWVEVTDIFGFISSDTVIVELPKFEKPETFLYCPGGTKEWNPNLGEHYDYLWSTGETTESIIINSPDDYHVEITDTNGCVYQSDTIYFDEDPFQNNISLGADRDSCAGNYLGLEEHNEDIASYSWSTGETSSTIELTTSDTYSVDLINENGCSAYDEVDITIIGEIPGISLDIEDKYCIGETFSYQYETSNDESQITTWSWDFGNGSTADVESGNYSYTNEGEYIISLLVETDDGCLDSDSKYINIYNIPYISIFSSNNCQGVPTSFNGGQTSAELITNWIWDFDDPESGGANVSTSQNTSHIYNEAGNYNIELTAINVHECENSIIKSIQILPAPDIDFSFEEDCVGEDIAFINNSSVQSPYEITSQRWTFGDGSFSTQESPVKPYFVSGEYNILLKVEANNGCSNDSIKTLKIHAIPQNDFVIDNLCSGVVSAFNDNSFVVNGSVAEVTWNFGDGSTATGFTSENIYGNAGEYELSHRVKSSFGCENFIIKPIKVNDYLNANFSLRPQSLIADFSTEFKNTSIGETSFYWSINDSIITDQQLVDFNFTESLLGDSISISLTANNDFGCEDVKTISLPVLRGRTDLALGQLFVQEINGFYTIGVEIENKGTTPIVKADLFLRTASTPLIKETWEGVLFEGEKEIYIFNASPPIANTSQNKQNDFVCVEGKLVSELGFIDEDLSNNERCKNVSGEETVILLPFPNPASNEVNIKLVLPEEETVSLAVYDQLGRKVRDLSKDESLKSGLNLFKIDVSNWSSGVYTVFLNTPSEKKVVKFSVL